MAGPQNELGCGFYRAQVWTRGGALVSDDLPVTQVAWSRVLSDVSEASCTLAGLGLNQACFDAIRTGRAWSHELALLRTTDPSGAGAEVWRGPITKKGSKLTAGSFEARDKSAWWDRRVIAFDDDPDEYTFTQVDVSTIFNAVAANADDQDPIGLTIEATPIGVLASRVYRPGNYLPAGPELRELTKAGVDWTIITTEALVGGIVVPADPIVFLQDDHLREAPQVDEDGMQFANDVIVSGAGGGEGPNPIVGRATDAASVAEFGLNTVTYVVDSVRDAASALSTAQSRLDLVKEPSKILGDVSLRQTAPVLMERLVPGAIVSCAFQTSGIEVAGQFRLQKVAVSGQGDGERVVLSLQPPGAGGDS